MKRVFVDTVYWIAVLHPRDAHAQAAMEARERLGVVEFVTTDEVLIEVLAALSRTGPHIRQRAAAFARNVLGHPQVHVIAQSRQTFLAGLARFERRGDKGYSLVDCISMNTMDKLGLREVLTHDKHFAQEGFRPLMAEETD